MARLRVLKDGVELQSVDLAKIGKPQLVVGRAPESDIKIDDRAVGREHAVFIVNSKGIIVQKKSKFGKMSVNGAELSESALKPGDVISIADYLVRVEEAEQAQIAAPAAEVANAPTSEIAAPGAFPNTSEEAPDLHAVAEAPTGALNLAENPPLTPEASALGIEQPALGDANSEAQTLDQGNEPVLASLGEGQASIEAPQGGDGMFVESERTAMIPQAKIVTKLVFKAGEANVEEYAIKKAEITIGRGSNCDIILSDKKSSRKHLVLKKVGMNFVAQDQGSGNGTYVNGVKITEQELAGDDLLRIGETEFVFKAVSQEYFEHEQDYQNVPDPVEQAPEAAIDPNMAAVPVDASGASLEQGAMGAAGVATDPSTVPGAIPGLSPDGPKKKETLLEKFRRQPPLRKVIIVAIIALGLFTLSQEEEQKPKPKPAVKVEKGDPQFEALPPEKKQFVMNTYRMAYDLYKNKDYERARYEAQKVLEIIPSGYLDTKELKAYAEKQLEIIKAEEEEKRRKAAEEALRQKIADLVAKAEELTIAAKYDEAKIVFGQILEIDPENPTVMRLKQQIEDIEAKRKAEEEARREKEFKKKMLEGTIREARELYQSGKYYDAIDKLADAPVIFAEDTKLLDEAKEIISLAKAALKEKAAPHLAAARTAMSEENFKAAADSFNKALRIDHKNAEAKLGLEKIRQILHNRSKRIYTDALIAEGVSDYKMARAKFKECLDGAMAGDIYFDRCKRKFTRLEYIDRSIASEPSAIDPKMPELPTPVDVDAPGGK